MLYKHYKENPKESFVEYDGKKLLSKFTKKACAFIQDGQPRTSLLLCGLEPMFSSINYETKTLCTHIYRKSYPKGLVNWIVEYAKSVGCNRRLQMSFGEDKCFTL